MEGKADVLLDLGGNLAPATVQGEWWRLLSAMFLHSGLMHLAFNMLALWDGGRVTERLLGRWRFFFLYLLAGVAGGIASINWQQDKVGIGASGAVFGIYGALATALLVTRDLLPPTVVQRLRTNAFLFIAYALVYGALQPQVDNAAHLGGLLAGAALAAVIFSPPRRAWAIGGGSALVLAFATLHAIQLAEPYRDELAFHRFLSDYSAEERRLNAILRKLLPPGPIADPGPLAQRLEQEVTAGWRGQEERIGELVKLGPENRATRDSLAEFIALKREALEILGEALRTDNQAKAAMALEKMAEANKVMQALTESVNGKGGN